MSEFTIRGLTLRAQRPPGSRRPQRVSLIFMFLVAFVAERAPSAVSGQAPQPSQPTQAQQRPVFRGGTHFVRVDAYPTTPDGKIVEGLKPEDFEILEDGKPQSIESFDFIKFDTFTPEAERRDPVSQRAGFDMAAASATALNGH